MYSRLLKTNHSSGCMPVKRPYSPHFKQITTKLPLSPTKSNTKSNLTQVGFNKLTDDEKTPKNYKNPEKSKYHNPFSLKPYSKPSSPDKSKSPLRSDKEVERVSFYKPNFNIKGGQKKQRDLKYDPMLNMLYDPKSMEYFKFKNVQ